MLVQSRYPPLSPLLLHGNAKFVSHFCQPGDGTGDGDTVVDVTLKHPNSEVLGEEMRIKPVAGIVEHGVVSGNIVATGIEAP